MAKKAKEIEQLRANKAELNAQLQTERKVFIEFMETHDKTVGADEAVEGLQVKSERMEAESQKFQKETAYYKGAIDS